MHLPWWLVKVFLILILSTACELSKLNVPRVLLPYYQDFPANFTLKVQEGGCYIWSTSRNIVAIQDISASQECSTEIVVSAITKSSIRQTAIILAKDQETGVSLRCDVIVDSIHRLEIVATTKELFVEEAPEEFEVRAYDDQGNEFSSLEGQHFIWDTQAITDMKNVGSTQNVLRFMTFESSPYETPPAIAPLEEKGYQGYMVLVEGQQTGLSRLSVRLENPLYKMVPAAYIDLMVVANLILEPQDVYILPYTSVEYTVFHLKHGIFHPVVIEGSHYSIQVDNLSVAKLNEDGLSVTGLSLGTTLVKLQDNNVKSSQTLKQPTASLHVVEPFQLAITIVPNNNPNIIHGHHYQFLIQLYDAMGNKILLSDNLRIKTTIPEEYFSTQFKSKNETYLSGIPIKTGATKVMAVLSAIEVDGNLVEISPTIEQSRDLYISEMIKVVPQFTVLPWNPVTRPTYNLTLTADRASGPVIWSSSIPNVAQVSKSGHCTTREMGRTIVTGSLASNIHNKGTAEIYVREATSLSLVPGIVETEVGKPLPLHIALFTQMDGIDVRFSSCFNVPFSVKPLDGTFIPTKEVRSPDSSESCATADVIGQTPGFTSISVHYRTSNDTLTASTMVGAFNPLKPINPLSGESTLAIDTSRIILFEGGPLAWYPASHYVEVKVEKQNIGTAELFKNVSSTRTKSDIHAVLVKCHGIGKMEVSLIVGNRPSSTLQFPQHSTATVNVFCSVPDSILIRPVVEKPTHLCPSVDELGYSIAHCERDVHIELVVSDTAGRTFDNISSLDFEWTLANSNIAKLLGGGVTKIQTAEIHGFSVPLRAETIIIPKGLPGDLDIQVGMEGLESSLHIHLVNTAVLSPSEVVLFNDKSTSAQVDVSGGSGFFYLEEVHDKVASLDYMQEERMIIVRPLSDGNLSVALLDACLENQKSLLAVKVASIGSIEVDVVDKVELKHTILAKVIIKDADGVVVPAHSSMMLSPIVTSSKLRIKLENITSDGHVIYKLTGEEVGDTCIKFSTQKSPKSSALIYSKCKPIQVFPPLTLEPQTVTIIVGASYQVKIKGGPYPDAMIEFSVQNQTVALSSHSGIVSGVALGVTKLTAKAISSENHGDHLVVYSQDTVTVEVIPLNRVYIHAPLKSIEQGSSMPVYAMGAKRNLNPMSYGSANPNLKFQWSISNPSVISLQKPFGNNGIEETSENACIMHLKAIKAGRVNIKLKVSGIITQPFDSFQIWENVILEDTIEIEVFESLKLRSPDTEDAKILMTPNSKTNIVTNLKHDGTLAYHVEDKINSPVTVSSNGLLEAGHSAGTATVIVTRTESSGIKQRLAVLVEVMPPSYILATPKVFMKTKDGDSTVKKVPVGSSYQLDISFHDNRGRVFHAANSDLKYRSSRFDLINVLPGSYNHSITLAVRSSGTTIFHITDAINTHLNDYAKISSGEVIQANKNTAAVGEQICFSTPVKGANDEPGTWKSDSSNLMIDPLTGIATAVRPGKSTISKEFSANFITTIDVTILPIAKIVIDTTRSVLSNTDIGRKIFIPVSFSSGKDLTWTSCDSDSFDDSSYIGSKNTKVSPIVTPFICHIELENKDEIHITDVLSTSVVFHPKEGYACEVSSITGPLLSISKSNVKVSLMVATSDKNVRSNTVTLPFYSAAVVDKEEILLTDVEPSAKLSIVGIPDVLSTLEVTNDDRLFDVLIQKESSSQYKVVITAKSTAWSGNVALVPTFATLYSPINMQTIEIKVNFEQVGPGICSDPGRQVGLIGLIFAIVTHYRYVLISILSFVLSVVFMFSAYRAVVGPGYKQSSDSVVFANSATPKGSNYSGYGNSPPKPDYSFMASTPSNNLWSVDREPVYGDPLFRSSPTKAYASSPVYRRSPP